MPNNEAVTPLFTDILPVNTREPVNIIEPVNSNVSALVEKSKLPLSPVALKLPETTREPEIVTF